MFKKMLFLPAVILGMIIGLSIHEACGDTPGAMSLDTPGFLVGMGVAIALFVALTCFIFRVRSHTFGLSPRQLKLAWIMAFLLGAFGTPLLYEIANR